MVKKMKYATLFIAGFFLIPVLLSAQSLRELGGGGDRYIRVAETGDLVDSVDVWGDVSSAGRYLIPQRTTLPELISFSYGYTPMRSRESDVDWAKTLIEVKVSRFNKQRRLIKVAYFKYPYNKPAPVDMFDFDLQNNDVVEVQVSRRPSFTDYVKVVAPVVSILATSILLVQNLRK